MLWNGAVVGTYNATNRAMQQISLTLTAQDGANVVGFREVGWADHTGTSLDDIQLYRLEGSPSTAQGSDTLEGYAGNDRLAGGGGDDTLRGGDGNDELQGDAGNDSLDGGTGDDVLTGGTGDDALVGGAGNDVYRFALGDGQDTITDSSGTDRIDFLAGIDPADVEVLQVDGRTDLELRVTGTGDRITVLNFFSNTAYAIETVRFADGTQWTEADLRRKVLEATSDANDSLSGSDADDFVDGKGGDDTLWGGAGDDTILGGTGRDTLYGNAGNDILDGGSDNDLLHGQDGDDTYLWGRDAGSDIITDTAGIDRIELASGIEPSDILVRVAGANIVLSLADGDGTLTLSGAATNAANAIESLEFADGTMWDLAELRRRSLVGDERDDTLSGTSGDDVLQGAGGNDTLSGSAGADLLEGGDGADTLDGGDGDDVLAGGTGDDLLKGGAGDDSYRFAAGDGADVIEDGSISTSDELRISGHALADARFGRRHGDLIVRFAGSSDSITLRGGLESGNGTIESIVFEDDAVALDMATVAAMLVADVEIEGNYLLGTAGDNSLSGTDLGDFAVIGSGADSVVLGAGDDRFSGVSGTNPSTA